MFNTFTINAGTNASGTTAAGGGSTTASYQINPGPTSSTYGYGWGTETWGASTWDEPRSSSNVVVEGRNWSLDNFGDKAISLIHDGEVFEWDSSLSNATDTRCTIISGAPTASRHMVVSTPDRHLVFFGTETTIGTKSTQDDMFIRFSDQENINYQEIDSVANRLRESINSVSYTHLTLPTKA